MAENPITSENPESEEEMMQWTNDPIVWGNSDAPTVNPLVWRCSEDEEQIMIPYLMFAPHCTFCGKPIEIYEGIPVGEIYPLGPFLCTECFEMFLGYCSYIERQTESGAWSKEQAQAFYERCWNHDDDGPYLY